MSMLILFLSFCLVSAIGVPIYAGLGASSLIYLLFSNPSFIAMVPQRIWAGTDAFMMIALPLFILAGDLMNRGGITKRIIDFSLQLVRPIKGGLAEVNVVASMFFGGISGSSVADTSALGSILIPAMEEKGYSRAYSTGVTVASSTMGMIIPPSVPMVTYAMVSGVSIGQLFLGGLVPGLLIGVLQIVAVQITKRIGKFRLSEGGNMPRRSFLSETREGFFALVMPLIIIGSIVFGVATASESAGVAVLYALLLGFFVFRELKLRDLPELLRKTAASSASVMIIIGFSMIFGWIMAIEKVPDLIAGFFLSLQIDRFWILIMLDLLILFVGTFLDVTPALLLLTPILLPVAQHFGISGVQFGIIMVVGTAIGLVTPPLGMCLNAANKIARMPIVEIFVAAVPFLICNLIVLLLVTFVPEISLWLPSLMK